MPVGPREWKPGIKTLKTRAQDNHGYEYRVILEMKKPDWQWILRIEETPGHWYMSTLLESAFDRYGGKILDRISVDAGQKWDIINFGDVLREAVALI